MTDGRGPPPRLVESRPSDVVGELPPGMEDGTGGRQGMYVLSLGRFYV